jgi:hypothetical protein
VTLTGIPPSIRQDRVRLERALAARDSAPDHESDVTSWEELQQRNAARANDQTVDFSRGPSMEPPTGYDHLGRPFPRPRNGLRNALRNPR